MVRVVADLWQVALQLDAELKVLEVAAGGQRRVGLLVEPEPVVDAAVQHADVHKVKGAGLPGPVELRVVDVELAVGRYPARLDGADVGADDLGGREGVRHVDGPYAGAGADVQDPGGLVDGCLVQLVAQESCDVVVGYVQAFILAVVVGAPVLGRLGVLVCPAMELAVFEDALGERPGLDPEAVMFSNNYFEWDISVNYLPAGSMPSSMPSSSPSFGF